MADLPTHNSLFRAVWTADSYVSTAVFEVWAFLRRVGSAYGSFLYRYFRVSGQQRLFIDLIDDLFTFGVIAAFGLLAYALPPFSGTGDVWNQGRAYAVTFTDQSGEIIGRRGIRQDDAIPLEEIPPHLIKAVLATEDVRFFDHFGVDVIGTMRALVRNLQNSGERQQGGSSITQQVAKNLFLSPERSIRRKVHEAFLSMWIEAHISKQEILKLYLDRNYMGGGNYGVEAASQFYFGKSVRDVTLAEAAILAGLYKAPTTYAPHLHYDEALARSNVVLYRMLDAGFITQGELLQAKRSPPLVVAQKDFDAPNWFLDWAYQDVLDTLEKYNLSHEFVIEVKTTIDRRLQKASEQIISAAVQLQSKEKKFTQAASLTMAPDGAVKAIVGGVDYEESQFNRATDAERQSGSAFKPFVYLTALLNGYKPNQVIEDGPVSVGNWSPRNYSGGFAGRTTLTSALAHSYNSVPVRLSLDVGRKAIIKATHDAGVKGKIDTYPPMVLGTSSLTLLDLTTGYATFAAGGKQAASYTVLEIKRPTGEVIYNRAANAPPPLQIFPEETIADLNSMLKAVVKAGTARRADLGFAPQGGKTGTTQSYRDAWYMGFTAHNVTGVWVGNDDYSTMNEVTGGHVPAPIWRDIMLVAEDGLPAEGLPGIPLDGTYSTVRTPPVLIADDPTVSDEKPAVISTETQAVETAPPDDARAVLDGMISLFNKKPDPGLRQAGNSGRNAAAKQRKRAQPLTSGGNKRMTMPKANAKPTARLSIFDSLFSSSRKSKPAQRQKKTLFNF